MRLKHIQIRVSEEELKSIKENAKKFDLNVTSYLKFLNANFNHLKELNKLNDLNIKEVL